MGVKNAMPVDRPTFDFYIETVKRIAPDASWCAAGIGAEPDRAQRMVHRRGRPLPHRARGQPAARRRPSSRASNAALVRAHGRALREVRPAGGDRRRGAGDPGASARRMISPFDAPLYAGLYGDAEMAAAFRRRGRGARDAARRGRARAGPGRARHHSRSERRRHRARGARRSRSTRPARWPGGMAGGRRAGVGAGRGIPRVAAARAWRLAALGGDQPGHRRYRADAAAARPSRPARRAARRADRRRSRPQAERHRGTVDRRAHPLPDRHPDDARRQDRGLDHAADPPPRSGSPSCARGSCASRWPAPRAPTPRSRAVARR